MTKNELTPGTHVHYPKPYYPYQRENGIIKSVGDDHAFVVYHWDNNPDDYMNYTGAHTKLKDLRVGWVDEKINLETP